ncbi:MAG TPA: Maf family protein [Acidimicrobiales bacterium]|nr:Maf family protein [Acidimicrobiales bacterium]
MKAPRLVLASGSPRRHALLASAGVRFSAEAPDIDESLLDGEEPAAYVERLAVEKAAAVTIVPRDVILAADTTVAVDRQIFGKPVDARDARRMLLALSGRAHDVHTGVAVVVDGRTRTAVATTRVTMAAYDDDIDWYVGTGEPLDKAGAYAMQGAGALLVRSISGSASNVVGLPLAVVADLLAAAGHPLSSFR